jgi:hypothetical protein
MTRSFAFGFHTGRQSLVGLSALCLAFIALFFVCVADATGRNLDPKSDFVMKERRPTLSQQDLPVVQYTAHNRGNIQLAIANNGTFGTHGSSIPDPFTGDPIPSCVFPKNSNVVYLWVAAVWIGAVVGRDTLVSVGDEDFYVTREFWPDIRPFGDFQYGSIDVNSQFYSPDAYSEEDIYCEYTDTITDPRLVSRDLKDGRSHIPLHVKVEQRSMAWGYSYAEDFILFDYSVQNIGHRRLEDLYLGLWVDGDAWHVSRNNPSGWNDDLVGFYRTHPAPEGCGFIDTVNIAWWSDNDGDPAPGGTHFNDSSCTGVVGVRVVRTPSRSLQYSYNWWVINYSNPALDFGPRLAGTAEHPYRNFGGRMGTPEGDRNKYYVMSRESFDYDLLFTAIDHTQEGFLPPPGNAEVLAGGFDTRFLLSFGPFNINPGERLPLSFAFVAGADFHHDPGAFRQLFDPYSPYAFNDQLGFENLAVNSRWASWVYDNPGVDTDGDGYYGEFRVCRLDSMLVRVDTLMYEPELLLDSVFEITDADTSWYLGDGVPDFRGAGPPQAPKMKLFPEQGKLRVRWNGYYSETTRDVFSGIVDFEGYRVYLARDDRRESFSLVGSYDIEDYNRYIYQTSGPARGEWQLLETPFSIDSLRLLYNDPTFQPLIYSRANPLIYNDTSYYFEKQDFNASDLTGINGIRKVYPDAPRPPANRNLWTSEVVVDYYDEPLPKHYEYEFVIENLLSTVPYWVSVTAFDFGSPVSGLEALETDPLNNYLVGYPQPTGEEVLDRNLDVFVYPNPYRIDAGYRRQGFEGRLNPDRPDDRVRAVNFANLPPRCTISIYTLDGDLVRQIEHDKPPDDPQSSHNYWNLITRNTQLAVSGLYYFVVESDRKTQIGKFMLIM